MKRPRLPLRTQMGLTTLLALLLIWVAAVYEIERSYRTVQHEAEVRTAVQAQVFAEYSRSTLKRLNEFILDIRTDWNGDWAAFAARVQQTRENIDDLSFQVAVIDKDGLLSFSNLAKPTDRTDLSQREHFRVHQEAGNADRLFISRPLKGKISGKWSIQVTRPILRKGVFDGVVVISVSPVQFASFAEKLRIKGKSVLTVVRDSGEVMARYPNAEGSLETVLEGRPYLEPDAPVTGNFRLNAVIDGTDRIFGYYRLPEYGMNFVVGEAIEDILAAYAPHRDTVVATAVSVSLLAIILFFVLYRSLAALEGTRRQLDAIFTLSPDGFVSFDQARRVKYVTPAFLRMTGLDVDSIIGMDEHAFASRMADLSIPDARFPPMETLREQTAAETDGLTRRNIVELAVPAGRVLEVGLRLSDAETVSQILYFRDITYETEVDRMKSEFLSTAAHELRTPMASVYGFSEVLLDHEFDAETQRELLTTIYRQSELMASIINELLDLARIEARRGKDFDLETFDMTKAVADAAAGYKPPRDRAAPAIQAAPAPLPIHADRQKIQQAVVNLISNAYKYSPEGGEVAISYRSVLEDGVALVGVEVLDHGIGMTEEQVERVCERFYRADTSGKIPGTGLGMSIVKEIVELHRGRIDIRSTPGEGTTVTLWLPLAAGA